MFGATVRAAGSPRISSVIPMTTSASYSRLTADASAFRSSISCSMRTGAAIIATAPGIRSAPNGRGLIIGSSHRVTARNRAVISNRAATSHRLVRSHRAITSHKAAHSSRIRASVQAARGMVLVVPGMTANHRKARRTAKTMAATGHRMTAVAVVVAVAESRDQHQDSLTPGRATHRRDRVLMIRSARGPIRARRHGHAPDQQLALREWN